MRGRSHACRPVNFKSNIAVGPALDLPDMQAHPNLQLTRSGRPPIGAQPSLDGHRSASRLRHVAESDEKPVASGPVHPPASGAHDAVHDLVIRPQYSHLLIAQRRSQAGRALDIREQHRDQTARRPGAHSAHGTFRFCLPRHRVKPAFRLTPLRCRQPHYRAAPLSGFSDRHRGGDRDPHVRFSACRYRRGRSRWRQSSSERGGPAGC